MQRATDRGEQRVVKRRREQGHAEWHPIAPETGGDSDRRQIEEIAEIGVAAEVFIERDRLGLDLGDAVGRASRR